eukprot:516062_1
MFRMICLMDIIDEDWFFNALQLMAFGKITKINCVPMLNNFSIMITNTHYKTQLQHNPSYQPVQNQIMIEELYADIYAKSKCNYLDMKNDQAPKSNGPLKILNIIANQRAWFNSNIMHSFTFE